MPQNDRYTFRPLTRADYPLIRGWLDQPHVGGWWGDSAIEIALMEEDFGNGPTVMRIVELDGNPFAFVQDYPAHHWPAPQFADQPRDARAIDTFLGDPAYLGQGHVKRYLHQRSEHLIAKGYSAIVVDADPTNTRALAAYRGAGFVPVAERVCDDGDMVLVMTYRRQMAKTA